MQVCVFVFDLLYWNGQPLLGRSLRQRRALLPLALPGMQPGLVQLATAVELTCGSGGASSGAAVQSRPPPGEAGGLDGLEGVDLSCFMPNAPQGTSGAAAAPGTAGASAAAASSHRPVEEPAAAASALASAARSEGDAAAGSPAAHALAPGPEGPQPAAPAPDNTVDSGGGGEAAAVAQEQAADSEAWVTAYMLGAFDAGCEGLMLKRLDGPGAAYEASKRADGWCALLAIHHRRHHHKKQSSMHTEGY